MSLTDVLLRDEFSDTVAAGAVNGTLATDGVNTRTVTDTTLKLFIGGGNLSLSGNLTPSYADPSLQYANIVRAAGVVAIFELTKANASGLGRYGWWSDINGSLGVMPLGNSDIYFIAPSAGTPIGTFPQSASVIFALALRVSGEMIFINTGPGWNLIFIHAIHSGNVRMSYRPYDDSATSKYIRVAGYWLPVPLVSDGFSNNGTSDGLGHAETSGLGSGGSGVAWSGTTWSVSGDKAVNTPGVGSDVVVNGNFATDTVWSKGTGWTIAGGKAVATSVSGFDLLASPLAIGKWYRVEFDVESYSTGTVRAGIGTILSPTRNANGHYAQTERALSTSLFMRGSSSATANVDNLTAKEMSLSDLLSLHTSTTPDVFAGIDITVVSGTQAGLALNWDSSSSPSNGVIAYHDGTNCKLEKCVAGTWTTVVNAAATYSANARLAVSKIGTAYRLYYNNALVGSGTISDAGIVNNTLHGRFNTYEGNTLDNYTCYASGTGGEYNSELQIVMSNERASSMAMTDSLLKVPVKILSDILSLSSSVLRTVIKAEAVQMALSSSVVRVVGKVATDILSLSSSVLRTVIKSEVVQMTLDSTAAKIAIKAFSDGIEFARTQAINYGKRIIRIIKLKGRTEAN